jgi:hypothetical protein
MESRPILFNAEMVKAILSGQKTQTRRVLKHPKGTSFNIDACTFSKNHDSNTFNAAFSNSATVHTVFECPYGKIGDRLWVKETYFDYTGTGLDLSSGTYGYRADKDQKGEEAFKHFGFKWKPSIFMPRVASRINLEITNARIEKLNGITRADALAEGISGYSLFRDVPLNLPQRRYSELWESINGDGSWDANPWVWVIEFKRIEI